MFDTTILTIFIPTIFVASITPSICMTLCFEFGSESRIPPHPLDDSRRASGCKWCFCNLCFWIILFILHYPNFFIFFKYLGGSYIIFLGVKNWLAKDTVDFTKAKNYRSNFNLVLQGFAASFFHPKAWAFLAVFLSSFIKKDAPLLPQVGLLLSVLLVIETNSLIIYAAGGKALQKILRKKNNIRLINFISGTLLVIVGLWLIII